MKVGEYVDKYLGGGYFFIDVWHKELFYFKDVDFDTYQLDYIPSYRYDYFLVSVKLTWFQRLISWSKFIYKYCVDLVTDEIITNIPCAIGVPYDGSPFFKMEKGKPMILETTPTFFVYYGYMFRVPMEVINGRLEVIIPLPRKYNYL